MRRGPKEMMRAKLEGMNEWKESRLLLCVVVWPARLPLGERYRLRMRHGSQSTLCLLTKA